MKKSSNFPTFLHWFWRNLNHISFIQTDMLSLYSHYFWHWLVTPWRIHYSDAKANQSLNMYVNFVSGWHCGQCCVTTHSWRLDTTCSSASAVMLLCQMWQHCSAHLWLQLFCRSCWVFVHVFPCFFCLLSSKSIKIFPVLWKGAISSWIITQIVRVFFAG